MLVRQFLLMQAADNRTCRASVAAGNGLRSEGASASGRFLSTNERERTVPSRMAYLRLVRPPAAERVADHECVQAFDRDLDYIFGTLRRLGAPPAEVEDLAHDVFVVLLRNWAALDKSRPLRPYLFGIAFRIVRAHRRRHVREVPHHSALESADERPGPEWLLQSHEASALLQAALERVPLTRRG